MLDGQSGDPRLATRGSPYGSFAKRGVVSIPLEHFAELMVVALSRERRTRGHDVAVRDQELSDRAGIVASRLERLDVRLGRCGQHLPVGRAALAVLVRKA